MRLRHLTIRTFGPFRKYTISFPEEDNACVLLTGKNNEGKSSIINALKLINAATRVIGKTRQRIFVDKDERFKLLQQDTEDLNVRRLIHNYADEKAEITARFNGGFEITVYLDPAEAIIYADFDGRIPQDIESIFGFIPPLGPLSETEEILSRESYLRANLNTSLAPRHLRNHLLKLLTKEQFDLVKKIVSASWEDIELLDYEVKYAENRVNCYYCEGRTDREISWAGQGLQVWFQIITHLVRLKDCQILVLDEPEINLHPEKQNELIRIIRDHFLGSVIIATHSVELMNNVSVSHILNVQKRSVGPKIKSTDDRPYLEHVRSQIGSNFNLIASQFEDCDIILFTEDVFDFSILRQLAEIYELRANVFNIPIHGFSEYTKATHYKDAYKMLIGKDARYSIVLDRDYYPNEYLDRVKNDMKPYGINVFFTPGKEIENVFLSPKIIERVIPTNLVHKYNSGIEKLFAAERIESWGSYLTLHKSHLSSKLDVKTITKTHMPDFEKRWQDPDKRWRMISGKHALGWIRDFIKTECGTNLPIAALVKHLATVGDSEVEKLMKSIYKK